MAITTFDIAQVSQLLLVGIVVSPELKCSHHHHQVVPKRIGHNKHQHLNIVFIYQCNKQHRVLPQHSENSAYRLIVTHSPSISGDIRSRSIVDQSLENCEKN